MSSGRSAASCRPENSHPPFASLYTADGPQHFFVLFGSSGRHNSAPARSRQYRPGSTIKFFGQCCASSVPLRNDTNRGGSWGVEAGKNAAGRHGGRSWTRFQLGGGGSLGFKNWLLVTSKMTGTKSCGKDTGNRAHGPCTSVGSSILPRPQHLNTVTLSADDTAAADSSSNNDIVVAETSSERPRVIFVRTTTTTTLIGCGLRAPSIPSDDDRRRQNVHNIMQQQRTQSFVVCN